MNTFLASGNSFILQELRIFGKCINAMIELLTG